MPRLSPLQLKISALKSCSTLCTSSKKPALSMLLRHLTGTLETVSVPTFGTALTGNQVHTSHFISELHDILLSIVQHF